MFTDNLSQNYRETKHVVKRLEDKNRSSQSTDGLAWLV